MIRHIFFRKVLRPRFIARVRKASNMYDPPYLESMKPKYPLYDRINIQMKSYDFVILENYQKVVHKIATDMDLDVTDCWAIPAKKHKIQKYKPNSSIVDDEYVLSTYERNIQVSDLPSMVAPIFFELIQSALPPGVTFVAHPHKDEHENERFVPDLELKELKTQLDSLGGPVIKRK